MNTKSRQEIFEQYLAEQKQYIVYNGINYTLLDEANNSIMHTNNPDELYTFILGFNRATNIAQPFIEELKQNNLTLNDQNVANIRNYEKIIQDMGGESLEEFKVSEKD